MNNPIIAPENLVYEKSKLIKDNVMHYCPGCSHGTVHHIIAEVIEEMGMEDKAMGVAPVGCAVFIYKYIDVDFAESAHGRAPALATAMKRLRPDNKLVFNLPGRRRSGRHWYRRNHPCLQQGRKHCHHFHQQWNLWNDRRANGPHHPERHEDFHLSLRKKRSLKRLSTQNHQLAG
jgi:pyruvate/2-oxoacid:ferredoxin oxidoreductase beta subunit